MTNFKYKHLGIIVGLVTLLGLSGVASGAVPAAYWYLDEAQDGPYEDTLNADNEARCDVGCPAYKDRDNVVGPAQTFDGADDGLLVAASGRTDRVFDWQDDEDFSIEIWFMMTNNAAYGGNNATGVLISRSDNTSGTGPLLDWWIGVRNVGGNGIRVAARLEDQDNDGDATLITNADDGTFVTITDGQWHQAILVKGGTTVNLYVDGTLEDTKTIDYTANGTTGFVSTVAPMSIGYYYVQQATPAKNNHFEGNIDQVALYNSALTQQEVTDSFTAGSGNELVQFEPVFAVSDFGAIAYGYDFESNVQAAGNPAVSAYALGTAPEGVSLDDANGDIAWKPTSLQIGAQTIQASATNSLATTTQELAIEVVDPCAALDGYWDMNETEAPFDGQVFAEPTHPDVNDANCVDPGDIATCPTQDTDTNAVNNALAFSGSQGLNVAASAQEDKGFDWAANESFTIAFFMKPDIANYADGKTSVMVGRVLDGGNNGQWWIGLRDDAGDPVAPRLFVRLVANNGDGDGIAITNTATPTAFTDGEWYHIAMVYDHTASTVNLYIDGVLEVTKTIAYDAATDFTNDANPLNIGQYDENANFYFDGSLDEMAFFGSALNAAILKQHAEGRTDRGFCNDVPVISGTPADTAEVNTPYTFSPTATDFETDTFTWSLTDKPDTMEIDAATGAITWQVSGADLAASPVKVTIVATDNYGGAGSMTFNVTVDGGPAPVIAGQTETPTIEEDATYTIKLSELTILEGENGTNYTLKVLDGDNYTSDGPTVTPAANFNGDLTVNVSVSDGTLDSAAYGFKITVTSVNDAPKITSKAPTKATAGKKYTYEATMEDPDKGDTFTWTLNNAPTGMEVSNSGVVTWTPKAGVTSSGKVTLTVSDGTATGTETFTVTTGSGGGGGGGGGGGCFIDSSLGVDSASRSKLPPLFLLIVAIMASAGIYRQMKN